MKKQSRGPHRLALGKETIRTLDRSVLTAAAGGDITSTTHPTVICPSVHPVCLTTVDRTL